MGYREPRPPGCRQRAKAGIGVRIVRFSFGIASDQQCARPIVISKDKVQSRLSYLS